MSAKRTIPNCNCDYKLQIGFYFPIQIVNYIILLYLPKYCPFMSKCSGICVSIVRIYTPGVYCFTKNCQKLNKYFFIKNKKKKKRVNYVMQKKNGMIVKSRIKTNSIFDVYISLYFWFCLFDDNKGILNFKIPKGIIGSIQFISTLSRIFPLPNYEQFTCLDRALLLFEITIRVY